MHTADYYVYLIVVHKLSELSLAVCTRSGHKFGSSSLDLLQFFLSAHSHPELLDANWRENQLTVKVKEIGTGDGNSEIRIVTEEPVSLIINLPNEITQKYDIQKEDKLFLTLLSIVKTIKKL